MTEFLCKYCGKKLSNKTSFDTHNKSAKYCLKLKLNSSNYICDCDVKFLNENELNDHKKQCKFYQLKIQCQNLEYQLKKQESRKSTVEIINNDILTINNIEIECKKSINRINLTKMLQTSDKIFANWYKNKATKEFLKEFGDMTGLSINDAMIVENNGSPTKRTIWAHPLIAINIAQWISPILAARATQWIIKNITI